MKRHLLLVGLPGAGKTTVGALVAAELAARHHDIDDDIERLTGLRIGEIFRRRGEGAFRDLERQAVNERLAGPVAVLTPGGGWMVHAEDLGRVRERALLVHLAVSVESALERIGSEADRPLLASSPRGSLAELARERNPVYGESEASVHTDDRTPADVAREVAGLARSIGGW